MIPEQLHSYSRFIKLESESKAPKVSPEGPFYNADDPELESWIQNGGNVGLNLGELVAFDVDSDRFRQIAENSLPDTFSIRTGSGGEHRYYRSEWSGKRQFSNGETDLGSVRSGNWYTVVPPSIHDETGNEYTVLHDRQIQPVPEIQIQDFLAEISEETNSQHSGGGGGGGCVGSSSISEIPSEYPNQSAQWSTLRNWLSANGLLEALNQTVSSDWSGLEFKLSKCLAEGGFSEESISDALDRLHRNSKWHSRGSDYKTRTVRNAITAAVNDPYVEFSSTGDMTGNTVESRKTESGEESTGFRGGVLDMVDDNVSNHVTKKNGSGVVRSGLVEVQTEDNSWEYVGVLFGEIEEEEDDLGTVVNWEYNQYNSKNYNDLGTRSPEELRLAAEALEELADELE
jgi:hypothetical protein